MSQKLLIIVDYQYDFVVGALGFEEAKALDSGMVFRVKKALNNGERVLVTMDTHDEDYLDTQEGKKLPVPHCIKDTPGWHIYGETAWAVADTTVLEKRTFGSDELMAELRRINAEVGGVSEIEICGIITNMCVISNAVIAKTALPECEIVINAALCASNDRQLHNKALDVMESMQMTIINR